MPTKVRANQVVTYAVNNNAGEQARARDNTANLIQYRECTKYNGLLSKAAAKKIKELVPNLALATAAVQVTDRRKGFTTLGKIVGRLRKNKPLLTFITLTLSSTQQHTDNEIKRECLQPFLAKLKRAGMMANYLWVAETQKNGNIHFHIVTNTYIKKETIRNYWNICQNKLGYTDRCQYTNPPSTKIEACKSITNISRYIAKYLVKSTQAITDNTANPEKERRRVEGRLWGCDTATEQLTALTLTNEQSGTINQEINTATTMLIEDKYYSIYFIDITRSEQFIKMLINHWQEIRR